MYNIFLYGGCVIRDAYTPLQNETKLSGYVARQSLISAMSPATTAFPPPTKLASAFQKRMVQGDHASNLVPQIRARADQIDLIVIDTNVERLGVYKLPNGSYVTRSPEMQQAGLVKKPAPPLLELGTPKHTEKFTDAATAFTKVLQELELAEKTLVIDAPLAYKDNEGEAFTVSAGLQVDNMRTGLIEITSILRDLDLKTVRMPEELAVGDVRHKWGRLPFHYIPPATEWVTEQIHQRLL